MKKLMSLGCLTALVLAGASAFAEVNGVWFSATLPADKTTTAEWTSIPDSWDATEKSFNDWTVPLTYKASAAVAVATEDATVNTSVKFTALDGTEGDPEELSQYTDAKAGLTIVQKGDEEFWYYGLVPGGEPAWIPMGTKMTALPENAVNVRISLLKTAEENLIKYYVNDVLLENGSVSAGSVASFQTISYYGNCPQIASLAGNKFDNTPTADPVSVDVKDVAVPGEIPATISYNRTDLASRGIDVDNADAVKTYLTGKQTNDQYGWVNTKLGIDDDDVIESQDVPQTNNFAAVDFGINVGEYDEGTVQYAVDGVKSSVAGIAISDTKESNKKISTVDLQVKGDDDKYYTIATETVGVMETGKATESLAENEKTYDIVAIPFAAFGSDPITVATVLNTAYLTEGDMLYVLNGDKYDTYVLLGDKTWKEVGGTSYRRTEVSGYNTPKPEDKDLTPGDAIWIERAKDSRIVFTGKGEKTTEHVWTWTSGEYSLVANPTLNDFSLVGKTFGEVGDMIIVEDATNPQHFEKRTEGWGELTTKTETNARGKKVVKQVFTVGGTIKAGIGFWYYKADAASEEHATLSINFGTNVTE